MDDSYTSVTPSEPQMKGQEEMFQTAPKVGREAALHYAEKVSVRVLLKIFNDNFNKIVIKLLSDS